MVARTASNHMYAMRTSGTQHFIERTYREGGSFQWVRETYINAVEAKATRIEFTVEWQAVENKGVYRRLIADNGKGMSREQLFEFFSTFGGGGKPIGGASENFGVGSKTSLLPWNTYGVVVVSWVDDVPSMIWLKKDPETGEYGLQNLSSVDEDGDPYIDAVYSPYYDEEAGCDWATVKPPWMGTNGTVIVLLGNSPNEDTVLGDRNREEDNVHGIIQYLNKRLWNIPPDIEVYVDNFQSDEKQRWPKKQEGAFQGKMQRRRVFGAKEYIEYSDERCNGSLKASGSLLLPDKTKAHWYLWEGERPQVHGYAEEFGFIAAIYKNELYNFQKHHAVYRSVGISANSVRKRLWIIYEPENYDEETKRGVFPTTDRNSLKLRGGPNAGDDLPMNDWASEFSNSMPDPIKRALADARADDMSSGNDDSWREKLIERFGSRWKTTRLIAQQLGKYMMSGVKIRPQTPAPGLKANRSETVRSVGPKQNRSSTMAPKLGTPARRASGTGGLPGWRRCKAEDFESPGIMAALEPKSSEHPNGCVLLNIEHPVMVQQLNHYQAEYADHLAQRIEEEVIGVYAQNAVAKIAHSEYLRSMFPATTIEESLRSPHALTLALLGFMAEDSIISTRLGGKFGKARLAV